MEEEEKRKEEAASHHIRVLDLSVELVKSGVWGHQDLAVLLHQLGEVVEQRVLLAEEVKLVVPLLPNHQLVQELGSIPGHKLSRQLHYVPMNT